MVRPREPLPTAVSGTRELPPEYGAALEAGLLELGVSLTADARDAIDAHARLLVAWTSAINLTAIRDPAAVALAHVVDSLAALPVLRDRGVDRFVDLGSGGGYPGFPLAVAAPAERALVSSLGRPPGAWSARQVERAAVRTGRPSVRRTTSMTSSTYSSAWPCSAAVRTQPLT